MSKGPLGFGEVLKILGTDWTVKERSDLLADEDKWGTTNSRTREIEYQPQGDLPVVFLHEIIHAGEHALSFTLDEKDVQLVARTLVATLRDNPDFLDWLFDLLHD
jgi:hypothetical protein